MAKNYLPEIHKVLKKCSANTAIYQFPEIKYDGTKYLIRYVIFPNAEFPGFIKETLLRRSIEFTLSA